MAVRLRPMTEAEFRSYREYAVREYANDKVAAGNWTPEESLEHADKEFTQLLPKGAATQDNFLYTIEDTSTDQRVGILWLALLRPDKGFIYDFEIDEAARRQGYATQALYELENVAREKGVQNIGLHVFAHNRAARMLYEKVGYVETNINMSKTITP